MLIVFVQNNYASDLFSGPMMPSNELSLLAFLYFIQGLPYGFQAKFLPILLRTEGVSLTNVGLFKFLLAPWLCKALWAPLVDKYRTKRHWLLYSITGLIFTCWFGIFIQPNYLVLLSILLFCLNLCAATQDIAVDSIAVSVLSVQQLGYGNTIQTVGYKVGSIFGGGVLVWFLDLIGWSGVFVTLSVLYIEALLFVYVSPTLQKLEISPQSEKCCILMGKTKSESIKLPDASGSKSEDKTKLGNCQADTYFNEILKC